MSKRIDPAHKATDGIIRAMEKDIAKEYAKANKEVQEKLSDYWRRFEKKDATWQEWVKNNIRTEEEYQKWRMQQLLVGKRWEEMKDSIATDYVNAHDMAERIVNGRMAEVYALNHNYATYAIEAAAKVDTSYTLYSRESVERLFRDNPKLYKRPGSATRKAIRNGELKRWNRKQIQSVMVQGIVQGDSIPNLTKRLEKVTGGNHKAAIRNARTMATGVQNAGRIEAYKRANDMGIPTKKTWLAAMDNRTRHWHRELDGETVDVDKPFKVELPDGTTDKIMYPGDPDADGANIYNCRCTLLSSVDGDEIDYTDPAIRHWDKDYSSYEEWEQGHTKSQPIDKQEKIGNAIKAEYIREYRNGGKH